MKHPLKLVLGVSLPKSLSMCDECCTLLPVIPQSEPHLNNQSYRPCHREAHLPSAACTWPAAVPHASRRASTNLFTRVTAAAHQHVRQPHERCAAACIMAHNHRKVSFHLNIPSAYFYGGPCCHEQLCTATYATGQHSQHLHVGNTWQVHTSCSYAVAGCPSAAHCTLMPVQLFTDDAMRPATYPLLRIYSNFF